MLRHYLAPSAHHLRAIRGFHFATLFLSFTLCLALGCQKKTEISGTQSDQTNQQGGQSNQSSASVLDKGDLKLRYQSRRNVRASDAAHKVGSNQQALEQVINNLNNRIALPWDITVSLEDCDGPNAYYEHTSHQLTICHQLI